MIYINTNAVKSKFIEIGVWYFSISVVLEFSLEIKLAKVLNNEDPCAIKNWRLVT